MRKNVGEYDMSLWNIKEPSQIKNYSEDNLMKLASDIRSYLIHQLSKTGGHLGSNLGTIELTIALHYVFNSSKDKLLWDIGHQTYTHKILTGRIKQFDSLRKYNGLSGFLRKEESPHDIWEAGHSSTSLSAATGMAIARLLDEADYEIVPIIGDGALTGGMALEALNHIADAQIPLKIVLNDNEMSISKNVGAIQKFLINIQIENKPILTKQIFEAFGFTYLGPVDGHDIHSLIDFFEESLTVEGPVLIHVLTKKGKGYGPAELDSTTHWHGIAPFDVNSGSMLNKDSKPNFISWSELVSNIIFKLAVKQKELIVLTPAMITGSKLENFERHLRSQLIDTGIAEQHTLTLAAGLALSKKIPFIAIYSTFLQRGFDQLIHDICRQNLHVVFGIDRAGLVGADGDTHHGIFDIAFLRNIPNMVVMMPYTSEECEFMLNFAINIHTGPIALRYPKNTIPIKTTNLINNESNVITLGTWNTLREGTDAVILTFGPTLELALQASEKLALMNVDVRVINARFIKPLDFNMLNELIAEKVLILTIEEGVLQGGFGSSVLEYMIMDKNFNGQFRRIGLPDYFMSHGSNEMLLLEAGITVDNIINEILILRSIKEDD